MKRIGIVGGGIGALHLGLFLRGHGVPVTIYTDKTASQQRAARLANVVVRSAPTRERERWLGVNHWDGAAPDLTCMSVSVGGPSPISFSGALTPPVQVVDMRIYTAALLDDFVLRGGHIKVGTLSSRDLETVAATHSLLVVAAGRGSLSNVFPRVPEHSPHAEPQRLVVAGVFRGIRYPATLGFDVAVSRGHGEILSFPLFSFQQGLTALGIEIVNGGGLASFGRMRYEDDPRAFDAAVLEVLREHAPAIHARIDPDTFGVARPVDVGHVAITPAVRRGYARLPNGRMALALGDAHVVMDPITGQGANKASHAAFVVGEALRDAEVFDEAFCEQVERRVCEFALPVSEACNARLQPPPAHVGRLLGAASHHQPLADLHALGFQHPDRYWGLLSSPDRTNTLLEELNTVGETALEPYAAALRGPANVSAWT
jgi:2-polyprenyl-6-methoxyphenol hydroxylase-like FAD-dependent oxidoreductase